MVLIPIKNISQVKHVVVTSNRTILNLDEWKIMMWYDIVDARNEDRFWEHIERRYSSDIVRLMRDYGTVGSNGYTTGLYVRCENVDDFIAITKLAG